MSSCIGAAQDGCFAAKRLLLGPHRARRARLYCVGAPKSGTHSVAAMFSRNVRACHEPDMLAVIGKLLDRHYGRLSESEFIEWLRERDRRLALEVDSAWINLDILEHLLREFPDGRFLLTIRDCYSSFDSQVNQYLRRLGKRKPAFIEWRNIRLGPGAFDYTPQDRILQECGAPTLDAYMRRWKDRIDYVIATVPPEKLLIVRTDHLTQRAFEIADFAGLPRRLVRVERSHAFRNTAKRPIVSKIDRDFLEQKVEQHCRPLMSRFFPEIRSLDDVKI